MNDTTPHRPPSTPGSPAIRQDVDLSIAAQLRALRDYADKNGYRVARHVRG